MFKKKKKSKEYLGQLTKARFNDSFSLRKSNDSLTSNKKGFIISQ